MLLILIQPGDSGMLLILIQPESQYVTILIQPVDSVCYSF